MFKQKKIYFDYCKYLQYKYGEVNKDYDENPRRRGKEWLDIHHIMEYEQLNLAERTMIAKELERLERKPPEGKLVIILNEEEWYKEKKTNELHEKYKGQHVAFYGRTETLSDLKPYNLREQLVYANKIEHVLLHYLIISMNQRKKITPGVSFLWDACVALDLYYLKQKNLQQIQINKETYYELMSSEEITMLYKKLIDWSKDDISSCTKYWCNFSSVITALEYERVRHIKDIDKFLHYMKLLQVNLSKQTIDDIFTLPYRAIRLKYDDKEALKIDGNFYSLDEKTIIYFGSNYLLGKKNLVIPDSIENIDSDALMRAIYIEKITIPQTVKYIHPNAFKRAIKLNEIIYKGTLTEWNERFSDVDISGITLKYNKRNKNKTN